MTGLYHMAGPIFVTYIYDISQVPHPFQQVEIAGCYFNCEG